EAGGAVGEVQDAALDEGPAVVDPYFHDLAVIDIGHHQGSAARQRARSGREVAHVGDLAACRAPPMMGIAVPGGQAAFLAPERGRPRRARGHGARAGGKQEQGNEAETGATDAAGVRHGPYGATGPRPRQSRTASPWAPRPWPLCSPWFPDTERDHVAGPAGPGGEAIHGEDHPDHGDRG